MKHNSSATKPPRVRENLDRKLKHNAGFAGGKILRKRMARLETRRRNHGHYAGATLPGSMK